MYYINATVLRDVMQNGNLLRKFGLTEDTLKRNDLGLPLQCYMQVVCCWSKKSNAPYSRLASNLKIKI